ncbi:polysaccharide deacetylase family protein [Aquiflexum sp.]|uniref:polysaccharide deacetylase family protein n=1 Tax=Aquiflexum sp. TaxID=1872584 RepID=UPI00359483B0
MKQICLIFHTHQPVRLKNYRFYEIGGKNSYFNDEYNKRELTFTAKKKFIPINKVLLDIFNNRQLKFKVSFSFTGSTLDLFEAYTPDLINNLKMMNQRGNVEFLGETYSHAFPEEFSREDLILQIENQRKKIFNIFGQTPTSFRNNGSYCNLFLSSILSDLGYKVLLNNTAEVFVSLPHPNTTFQFCEKPDIKLLFGNKDITEAILKSKNITSNKVPMTAEMLTTWINKLPEYQDIVTLFIDFNAIIKDHSTDTTLLDFLRELPTKAKENNIGFITPSEIIKGDNYTAMPISMRSIKSPEELQEMDVVEKPLQNEIRNLLFSLKKRVYQTKNDSLIRTWYYLQDNSNLDALDDKKEFDEDTMKEDFQKTIDTYINLRNILQDLTFKVDHLLEEKNFDFGQTFCLTDTNEVSYEKEPVL